MMDQRTAGPSDAELLRRIAQRDHAVLGELYDRVAGVLFATAFHVLGDRREAEDLLVLTGDLTVAGRRLGPGDFHHCDAGTSHPVNFSDEGCTLLAVLSLDHELARFAMA